MRSATSRALIPCLSLLASLTLLAACSGHVSNPVPYCEGCQFLYATTTSGQIVIATLNGNAPDATRTILGPAGSRGMALSWRQPGNPHLYVSDPVANAIRVYDISMADGGLAPASFGPYTLGGAGSAPEQLVLAGHNPTLYAASSAGLIFAFSANADGSLTPVPGSPFAAGAGVSHLCAEVAPPANSANDAYLLYAANTDDPAGGISAFTMSPNGALTPVSGSPFPTVANGGPQGLDCTGATLYAALRNAGEVAAFSVAADGSLAPIAGSPFASGRGTSSLSSVGYYMLIAANAGDATISAYRVDPATGELTPFAGSPFPAAPASGDLINLGANWYLPDASANSLYAYQPSPLTGALNPVHGSPFQLGEGPLELELLAIPIM